MIWILLYICLAGFVIGLFVWTTRVLFQQKKAWRAYAKKYKLTCENNSFFSSAYVHGILGDNRINVFSEEQLSPDGRGTRFRSVIELMRESPVPTRAALASGDLVALVSEIEDMAHSYTPVSDSWNATWAAKTDEKSVLKRYLTEQRLQALQSVFKIKNTSSIFIFDGEDALLRFETGDPLHDPRKLDKIVKKMEEAQSVLVTKPGEFPESKKAKKEEPEEEAPEPEEPQAEAEVPAEEETVPVKEKPPPKKKAAKKSQAAR